MAEEIRPVVMSWSGVTARRMARNALTDPATEVGPAEIAGLMCGAHAQVLSSAEVSIGTTASSAASTA